MVLVHAPPPECGPRALKSARPRRVASLTFGLVGITALLLLGVLILREHAWTITTKDLAYWTIVLAMLGATFVHARQREALAPHLVFGCFAATLLPVASFCWYLAQSFCV